MAERLFTTYQIAELLQTTPGTVVEWMDKGWLPFKRLSDGPVRIAERQLIEFLKNQGIDLAQIMAKVATGNGDEPEGEYQPEQPDAGHRQDRRPTALPVNDTDGQDQQIGENQSPADHPLEAEEPYMDGPEAETESVETPVEPETAEEPAAEAAAEAPAEQEPSEQLAAESEAPAAWGTEAEENQDDEVSEMPAPPESPEQPSEQEASEQPKEPEEPPAPEEAEPPVRQPALPDAPDALVEVMLRDALANGAEYVHLDPSGEGYAVLMRSARGLVERDRYRPRLAGKGGIDVVEHIKALAGVPAGGGRPLLGSFARTVEGRDVEVRLSTCPTLRGEKLLLQVSPSAPPVGLSDLGFDAQQLARVRAVLDAPGGLVLVTAPPRSGRRTTLRALAGEGVRLNRSVIAVEKPPATPLEGVLQVPTASGGTPFGEAARAAAGMDCDTLLIEDLTEPPVASAALAAAEDGATVLAGMRATDAAAAIVELVAMGVGEWLAARLLRCVITQRAVRTICPECRREITLGDDQLAAIGLGEREDFGAYTPVGCDVCDGSGYAGRTAVFAIRDQTQAMRLGLRSRADAESIRRLLGKPERELLGQAAVEKLRAGVTSPQEVADALRM